MNTDEIIQKYFNDFDKYIVVPNEISYNIQNFTYSKKGNNILNLLKKIIAIILGICTLAGGLVFAKDYILKTFNLGGGIDTAVDNGYIYTNEEINSKDLDSSGTEATIKDFLMDDTNVSSKISIELPDKLDKNIDIKKIKSIELIDMIITDENNNILYCADESSLSIFCQNNNLNYKFGESTDHYFNSGVNSFLEPSSEDNIINLTYNVYLGNIEKNYPRSKILKYEFHKIKLIENYENDATGKTLVGNWKIEINVPEKMYNRNSMTYRVINCSNENIDVTTAKVTDTGFEFGCTIHNIKIPEEIQQYRKKFKEKGTKGFDVLMQFLETDFPIDPVILYYDSNFGETIEDCTYIANEKNKKFLTSTNPGRKQKQLFINDDKDVVFYETFDLTKYDATNELNLHLVVYDASTTIKLEKSN